MGSVFLLLNQSWPVAAWTDGAWGNDAFDFCLAFERAKSICLSLLDPWMHPMRLTTWRDLATAWRERSIQLNSVFKPTWGRSTHVSETILYFPFCCCVGIKSGGWVWFIHYSGFHVIHIFCVSPLTSARHNDSVFKTSLGFISLKNLILAS